MYKAWKYGAAIDGMVGRTFVSVVQNKSNKGDDTIVFTEADGTRWVFAHEQECCEEVSIEDVSGDLSDLVGTPLLRAEEVDSDPPAGHEPGPESETWTFYKFATVKGDVDVRWYGASNGYYSESVDLYRYPIGCEDSA